MLIRLLLLFLILLPLKIMGQISWDKTSIECHPALSETNISTIFRFKNNGTNAMVISALKPSCECVHPSVEKMVFLPLESGDVKINFNLGHRKGIQKKTVVVETIDPKNPITELNLTVYIDEVIRIHPGSISWDIQEKHETKRIGIEVADSISINGLKVQPFDSTFNESFKTELLEISKGRKYELSITPLASCKSNDWDLEVFVDSKNLSLNKANKFVIHVQMKLPEE